MIPGGSPCGFTNSAAGHTYRWPFVNRATEPGKRPGELQRPGVRRVEGKDDRIFHGASHEIKGVSCELSLVAQIWGFPDGGFPWFWRRPRKTPMMDGEKFVENPISKIDDVRAE